MEGIIEVSSNSAGVSGGKMAGSRAAIIDLPAPGRADEQQIVAAGRGDLQRPLGALLALDVARSRPPVPSRTGQARPREDLVSAEMVGKRDQGARREDLQSRAAQAASGRTGRADQASAQRIGADGGGQGAGHRRDRSIETQLADDGAAGKGIGRDRADGRHEPKRDRQIVVAAFLGKVGGREVDGDAAGRERQTRCRQSPAHPLAAFATALSGRPTTLNAGMPGATCTCTSTRARLDTFERHRRNALDHRDSRPGKYYLEAQRQRKNI